MWAGRYFQTPKFHQVSWKILEIFPWDIFEQNFLLRLYSRVKKNVKILQKHSSRLFLKAVLLNFCSLFLHNKSSWQHLKTLIFTQKMIMVFLWFWNIKLRTILFMGNCQNLFNHGVIILSKSNNSYLYWNIRASASRWFYYKILLWNFKYYRMQIKKVSYWLTSKQ